MVFLQQNIQIVFVIVFSLSVVGFAVSYFYGLEETVIDYPVMQRAEDEN